MKNIVLCVLWIALFCCGCSLIDIHPYDADPDAPRGINRANIEIIERDYKDQSELVFAVISDTQRWYDETADAVKSINAREDIDFIIHCGDLTDFGATKEFEWMSRELECLNKPYVCIIGNHDCLGNGEAVYREIYGDLNFSFTVGDTHFLCLNTNALEFDYSEAVPNMAYIVNTRSNLPQNVKRTIVAMHAMPFTDQFNNNIASYFHEELKQFPGLQYCICGHTHTTGVSIPFSDDFKYYICGAAEKREYLVFKLNADGGYEYEVVAY